MSKQWAIRRRDVVAVIATSTMVIVTSSGTIEIPVIPVLVSRPWPAVFLHGILSGPCMSVVVLLPRVLGRTIIVPKREPTLRVHVLLLPLRPPIIVAAV